MNCTQGAVSADVFCSIEPTNLVDKVLIDVANPLDLSDGKPPMLTICNSDSLGERLQRECLMMKVVKIRSFEANRDRMDRSARHHAGRRAT